MLTHAIDFEGLIRDLYVALLRPGDIAVDCGAHHGDHTLQMAAAVAQTRRGWRQRLGLDRGGRIIAIEPAAESCEHMRRLMAGPYAAVAPVIDLRQVAVGAKAGIAPFYFAPAIPSQSGLSRRPGTVHTPLVETTVEVTTLDALCAGLPIRYIKMDVEGGEYDVLRGAVETIKRCRPVITFEHNDDSPRHFGYQAGALMQFFRERGYRVKDLLGREHYMLPRDVWDFVAEPV